MHFSTNDGTTTSSPEALWWPDAAVLKLQHTLMHAQPCRGVLDPFDAESPWEQSQSASLDEQVGNKRARTVSGSDRGPELRRLNGGGLADKHDRGDELGASSPATFAPAAVGVSDGGVTQCLEVDLLQALEAVSNQLHSKACAGDEEKMNRCAAKLKELLDRPLSPRGPLHSFCRLAQRPTKSPSPGFAEAVRRHSCIRLPARPVAAPAGVAPQERRPPRPSASSRCTRCPRAGACLAPEPRQQPNPRPRAPRAWKALPMSAVPKPPRRSPCRRLCIGFSRPLELSATLTAPPTHAAVVSWPR